MQGRRRRRRTFQQLARKLSLAATVSFLPKRNSRFLRSKSIPLELSTSAQAPVLPSIPFTGRSPKQWANKNDEFLIKYLSWPSGNCR